MNGDVLGIIPAGGKAERFGGVIKELLPVGDHVRLIDRAMMALHKAGAKRYLVITSKEKYTYHVNALDIWKPYFVIQSYPEIWGAVRHSLEICGAHNILVMPDTYFPVDAIPQNFTRHLSFGYFITQKPERFGVIEDGKVVDKQAHPPGHYLAWGVLRWSNEVAHFWRRSKYESLPEALTGAMQRYGYDTFKLDYYHDMARFEDYKELLCA